MESGSQWRTSVAGEARAKGHLAIGFKKGGQEPIVQSTLRAIWLLVPDPFFKVLHFADPFEAFPGIVPVICISRMKFGDGF